MKLSILAAAFGAALLVSAPAFAVPIVTNGSFEAEASPYNGTITGWTYSGFCSVRSVVQNVDSGMGVAPPATDGVNVLQIGNVMFTADCAASQSIAVPTGTSASLNLALGSDWGNGASANSYITVDIVPSVGPPVTVYTLPSAATMTPVLTEIPTVNLTPYLGQTITLQITHHSGNYYRAYVDNVRVSVVAPPAIVPTLGEWAMILLTGLLAVAGGLSLAKRRAVA